MSTLAWLLVCWVFGSLMFGLGWWLGARMAIDRCAEIAADMKRGVA